MSDVKGLIAKARLPEKTVTVFLDTGLSDEFDRLEKLLEDEQAKVVDSLNGNLAARDLAAQLAELREEMQACRLDLKLRALPRAAWRELVEAHPPRKDDAGEMVEKDDVIGVNVDTLIPVLIRRSIIAPELDDEDMDHLFGDAGVLNDAQFNRVAAAAWVLNRGDVDVPFSFAASKILDSEPESKRRNGSGSA
jgi:hypothetical protein